MIYVAIFTVTPHIHYVLHFEPKPLVFSLCIALSSLALLHYLTGIDTIQYDRVQPQNVKESTHRRKEQNEGRHNVSKSVINNSLALELCTSSCSAYTAYLTHPISFQNWRTLLQQILNCTYVPIATGFMNR